MDKVKARFIIEIMGRPAKHVAGALKEHIEKIASEKGIEIIDKRLHEPKPVEETKNLFTTFAEIDAEFESLDELLMVLFTYMPSNIEIYSPEKMKIRADTFNSIINSIATRLHHYDAIAKRLVAEKDILTNQLEQLKSGKKTEVKEKPIKKKTIKKKLLKNLQERKTKRNN